MSDEMDLDAIEARADAATPGPWVALCDGYGDASGGTTEHERRDLFIVRSGPTNRDDVVTTYGSWNENSPNDAEFIAHARTDIPALVARCKAAEAKVARMEAMHVPWYEINGVRHEHRVIVTAWEDGDLPADHVCSTEPGEDCMDDEHYVLACTECRGATDEGGVGYSFWPCSTLTALTSETSEG